MAIHKSAGFEIEDQEQADLLKACSSCGRSPEIGEQWHQAYENGQDTGNVLCPECANGYPELPYAYVRGDFTKLLDRIIGDRRIQPDGQGGFVTESLTAEIRFAAEQEEDWPSDVAEAMVEWALDQCAHTSEARVKAGLELPDEIARAVTRIETKYRTRAAADDEVEVSGYVPNHIFDDVVDELSNRGYDVVVCGDADGDTSALSISRP